MIDVEFYGKRKVIAAWKIYLDHLVSDFPKDQPALDRGGERRDDLLTDLLYEMGTSLKYNFDKVQIRRAVYSPKGHFDVEQDFNVIRKALVDILSGKTAIPMEVRNFNELTPTPELAAASKLLADLAERERQRLLPSAD
jgi:hypothetical protein